MSVSSFVLIALLIVFAYLTLTKYPNRSSNQLMLLGIELTIFGGVLILDRDSHFSGLEYVIFISGLFANLLGFIRD